MLTSQMEYKTKDETQAIHIQLNAFEGKGGVTDYHLLLSITNPLLSFKEQLQIIRQSYAAIVEEKLGRKAVAVFRRYFLSDAANQADLLAEQESLNPFCALSVIQQAPLNGTKIALWAYLQTGSGIENETHSSGMFEAAHNGYRHLWAGNLHSKAADPEYQTRLALEDYILRLTEQGGTLASNCIRTWFFVQNIDVNYAGVVKARKEVFFTQDLTEKTHYIASTGIEGRNADPQVLTTMDAYAVDGLLPEQIRYLYAKTHLNPTYEYGVTFERGVAVTYGDRKHIFLSGTASIDNRGNILYPGNILKQTERMLENIRALLEEAGASLRDIKQALVYLRDPSDYQVVERYIQAHHPYLPHLIMLAPVCRPGWLIETECIAITGDGDPKYNCL